LFKKSILREDRFIFLQFFWIPSDKKQWKVIKILQLNFWMNCTTDYGQMEGISKIVIIPFYCHLSSNHERQSSYQNNYFQVRITPDVNERMMRLNCLEILSLISNHPSRTFYHRIFPFIWNRSFDRTLFPFSIYFLL
jgi:hypothetical protein